MGLSCSHDGECSEEIVPRTRKLRCDRRMPTNNANPTHRAPLMPVASPVAHRSDASSNPLTTDPHFNLEQDNNDSDVVDELQSPTSAVMDGGTSIPSVVGPPRDAAADTLPMEKQQVPPVEYTVGALHVVGSNCSSAVATHSTEDSGKSGNSGVQLADFYSVSQLGNEFAKNSLTGSSALDLQSALAVARKGHPPRPMRNHALPAMSPKSYSSLQRCARPLSITSEVASNSLSARSLPCFEALQVSK